MLGIEQDVFHRTILDDAALVHDHNAVGDVPREPEVVRDHERAEPEVAAQLQQQGEDLAAHGCVEAGDRLVGHEVEWEHTAHSLPVSAPVDGPWFAAMRDAVCAADPGAVVFPYCMGGGTDAKAFAPLGIAGYGFAPLGEDPDGRLAEGVHGVDERVPVASLLWGLQVLDDFLTRT